MDYVMVTVGAAAAAFVFGYYVKGKEVERWLPPTTEGLRDEPKVKEDFEDSFPLERARLLYTHGMSLAQVASTIGWSQSTIHKRLKGAGVEMRLAGRPAKTKGKPKKAKRTSHRGSFPLERAKEMYAGGMTGAVIAKELGYSPQYIYLQLKRAGVQMRPVFGRAA